MNSLLTITNVHYCGKLQYYSINAFEVKKKKKKKRKFMTHRSFNAEEDDTSKIGLNCPYLRPKTVLTRANINNLNNRGANSCKLKINEVSKAGIPAIFPVIATKAVTK